MLQGAQLLFATEPAEGEQAPELTEEESEQIPEPLSNYPRLQS